MVCRPIAGGFVVNNVHVRGPILAYSNVWLLWAVQSAGEVTPDSLALLQLIRPVPDLLVFGSGAHAGRPAKEALQMLRSAGIALEALPTVCFCCI